MLADELFFDRAGIFNGVVVFKERLDLVVLILVARYHKAYLASLG